MRASRSGCTLASRWMVATTYPPGASPSRSRTVDRSRAIGPSRKHASAMTSPTTSIRPGTPSPRRICRRALVRTEQQRGDPVDRDPVPLLRHRPVAAPQARLDVRDRNPGVERRLGPRERRVRIAVHERPVGPLRLERRRDPRPHRAPRRRVCRSSRYAGSGSPSSSKKTSDSSRSQCWPVCSDTSSIPASRSATRERAGLDELRPVADHRENLHEREATMRRSRSVGPLAQLVEQGTLNPKVEGSNPSRPIASRPDGVGPFA